MRRSESAGWRVENRSFPRKLSEITDGVADHGTACASSNVFGVGEVPWKANRAFRIASRDVHASSTASVSTKTLFIRRLNRCVARSLVPRQRCVHAHHRTKLTTKYPSLRPPSTCCSFSPPPSRFSRRANYSRLPSIFLYSLRTWVNLREREKNPPLKFTTYV